MILPVRAYGDSILRAKCVEIDKNYPEIDKIIYNMYETMDSSNGVGIAAPQVGIPIRVFLVDVSAFAEDEEDEEEINKLKDFRRTFINAKKISEDGESWKFNEGCLSIPGIREDVERKERITLKFMDENFVEKVETFDGIAARVIQHEYDHINGVLFTDYLSPFKKRLIKKKLNNIKNGIVSVDYKMRFPK